MPAGRAASLSSCSTTTSQRCEATFSRSFQSRLARFRKWVRSEVALRVDSDTS